MKISGKEISEETIKTALEAYGISFDEPKPENWDYGIDVNGCPYFVINDRIMWVEEGRFSGILKPGDSAFRNTAKGNLKRELKELAKPPEKIFKQICFADIEIRSSGVLSQAGNDIYIDYELFDAFVLSLRRHQTR